MAADDVVGIDVDGHLAADPPFAFEGRCFEGVDASGGPCEKTTVQVDAVDQPIREQEGGVIVLHAHADILPKNGFIQRFQRLIGDRPLVHILMNESPCFVFQRLKSNADKLPSLKEIKPHFLIPSNHL